MVGALALLGTICGVSSLFLSVYNTILIKSRERVKTDIIEPPARSRPASFLSQGPEQEEEENEYWDDSWDEGFEDETEEMLR